MALYAAQLFDMIWLLFISYEVGNSAIRTAYGGQTRIILTPAGNEMIGRDIGFARAAYRECPSHPHFIASTDEKKIVWKYILPAVHNFQVSFAP